MGGELSASLCAAQQFQSKIKALQILCADIFEDLQLLQDHRKESCRAHIARTDNKRLDLLKGSRQLGITGMGGKGTKAAVCFLEMVDPVKIKTKPLAGQRSHNGLHGSRVCHRRDHHP